MLIPIANPVPTLAVDAIKQDMLRAARPPDPLVEPCGGIKANIRNVHSLT